VCEHPEWVDDPRFDTPPDRRINREVLEPAIEEALSRFDRAEVTRRLEKADIPYGDLNEISQFLEHPQLEARDRWREVGSPAGPLKAILPAMIIEGFEPVMGDIPAAGQHTIEILEEIGFDAEQIAGLRAAGAV
jgi:crotonobetainyl-CoA:carnitine CoA-transferase CaiB-like acyl-CoA transferase